MGFNLVAEKNIPAVHFATSGAATVSFLYHMHTRIGSEYPFSCIFLRDYEERKLRILVDSNKDVADDYAFRSFELSSEIVLIKTSRELEKKYLDHLSYRCGKELVCVGPLVQESNSQEGDNHGDADIINFLHSTDQASAVYVSFGSEYFLSEEERDEIVYGLEISNVNFIWVIRFPVGQKLSIEEAVPKGFLN